MAHRQSLRPLARRAFPALLAVLATGVSAAGCDDADAPPSGGDAAAPDAKTDATTDAPDAADAGAPEAPAVRRCFPPAGISGTPGSIAEAVRLVNALPRPVTVECFLESLDRPLYAVATQSTISLQPAVGSRSPRIFLITSKLIMSIVPDGKGSELVEFGQFVDERRTLKGEIHFPVVSDVLPAEPFERIKSTMPTSSGQPGTTCRFCHADEERAPDIDFAAAFISVALKPDSRTLVGLERVRRERDICDDSMEAHRCAILRALLDHGAVEPGEFPKMVPTIFNN